MAPAPHNPVALWSTSEMGVAEHIQLLLVFSTHTFFLSGCAVETREFRGTASVSNRVFPQPASPLGSEVAHNEQCDEKSWTVISFFFSSPLNDMRLITSSDPYPPTDFPSTLQVSIRAPRCSAGRRNLVGTGLSLLSPTCGLVEPQVSSRSPGSRA